VLPGAQDPPKEEAQVRQRIREREEERVAERRERVELAKRDADFEHQYRNAMTQSLQLACSSLAELVRLQKQLFAELKEEREEKEEKKEKRRRDFDEDKDQENANKRPKLDDDTTA
jgi:hypothetical protein